MADTITKNVKLVKFEAGSRVNTWKPDFDTELMDPLDSMMGEKLAVTVDTIDVTLSTAQFRAAMLACSGTLTGSRALIMPGIQERWLMVDNRCVATPPNTYVLQAKQDVAGALADIPYGPCFVHWDGSAAAPTVMPVPIYGVTDVATATNCLIGNTPTVDVRLTGAVTITSFGIAPSGVIKRVRSSADGLTITYNATSMQTPGSVNLILNTGDSIAVLSTGSSNWVVIGINRSTDYSSSVFGPEVSLTSATTTDLNISTNNALMNLGVTPITSFGSAAPIYKVVLIRFNGTIVLTSSANILTPGSVDITANSGDMMLVEHFATSVWRVINIVRSSGNLVATNVTATNGVTVTGGAIATNNSVASSGALSLTNTDGTGTLHAPYVQMIRQSATPAAGDLCGYLGYYGNNSSLTLVAYANIRQEIVNITPATQAARLICSVQAVGSSQEYWRCYGGTVTAAMGMGIFRSSDVSDPSSVNNSGFQVRSDGWTTIEGPTALCLSLKLITAATAGTLMNFHAGTTVQGSITYNGSGVFSFNAFIGAHWSSFEDNSKPDIPHGTIMETVDRMVEWIGFRYTDHRGDVLDCDGLPEGVDKTKKFNPGDKVDFTERWEEDDPESPPDTESGAKRRRQREKKHKAEVIILDNDTLPYCKIAGPGSERVYGVYLGELVHDGIHHDFNVASLGAYFIRMAPGENPKGGDLIESAGNGLGRVITDENITAMQLAKRMVGKITAAVKIRSYQDGSFIMPCTLHCG